MVREFARSRMPNLSAPFATAPGETAYILAVRECRTSAQTRLAHIRADADVLPQVVGGCEGAELSTDDLVTYAST